MRKSILFIMMVAVAFFAVACGGNNAASNGGGGTTTGGEAAADPMKFYKKAGNYYMTKSTMKVGDNEMVTYMKMEITKSDDKGYVTTTYTYDKDKKETSKTESPMVEWPKPVETAATGAEAPKVTEEEVEVPAGKFKCIKTEASGTTSWSFNGIPVKMKSDTMEMVLVELKNE